MQLSSTQHLVDEDRCFLKFELMFNIHFEDDSAGQAFYQVQCEGCLSVIGAKPATLSSRAVIQSLGSENLNNDDEDEMGVSVFAGSQRDAINEEKRQSIQKAQVLWWIDKSALYKRPSKQIRIALKSLKSDEIKTLRAKIEESVALFHRVQEAHQNTSFVSNVATAQATAADIPKLVFTEEVLAKAALRGYESDKGEEADLTILVHKCEGRVFLTDRNGFYNDLLKEEWVSKGGNVLIVLTGNRTALDEDKLTNADVQTMATQGDQPTLKLFEDKRQIFVWNRQPSTFQKLALAERIIESIYRQELVLARSEEPLYRDFLDLKYFTIAPQVQRQESLSKHFWQQFELENSDHIKAHSSFHGGDKRPDGINSAAVSVLNNGVQDRRKGIGFTLEDRSRQQQSIWSRCFS